MTSLSPETQGVTNIFARSERVGRSYATGYIKKCWAFQQAQMLKTGIFIPNT
jgi:hypothetical protein